MTNKSFHTRAHSGIGAINEERRSVAVTIATTGRKDDGIDLRAGGWVLDDFNRNPVVLWAHDGFSPPIGRGTGLIEDQVSGDLTGEAIFTTKDENPLGDTAFKLFKGRFLNAVSARFRMLDFARVDEGFDSFSHSLKEFSAAPVPVDPTALVAGRASGIDVMPVVEWAERMLDAYHGTNNQPEALERIAAVESNGLVTFRYVVELGEVSKTYEIEGRRDDVMPLAAQLVETVDSDAEEIEEVSEELSTDESEGNNETEEGDTVFEVTLPTTEE